MSALLLGYGPLYGTLLWVGLAAACWSDLRHRKVPNALNLSLGLAGVAGQVANSGLSGLADAGLGLLTAFALVIVPFAVRLYRGGDAKLVMALGVWLGPASAAWSFLFGVAWGGLVAAGVYLATDQATRGSIRANLRAAARTATVPVVEERTARAHVPMALPFSLGVATAALWR